MKMLLTSGGIRNDTIMQALVELVGKPFQAANICFIPTASTAESGHHDWFVDDLNRIYDLGWRQFDILDMNGLPKAMILDRLREADVVYVEGGNTYALAKAIADQDLAGELLSLLDQKVYVGVSAGSMIFSKNLTEHMVAWHGSNEALYRANDKKQISPFNLFEWFLKPHIDFETWEVHEMGFPYYALDDQSALKIVNNKIEVVSEGQWELVTPKL